MPGPKKLVPTFEKLQVLLNRFKKVIVEINKHIKLRQWHECVWNYTGSFCIWEKSDKKASRFESHVFIFVVGYSYILCVMKLFAGGCNL